MTKDQMMPKYEAGERACPICSESLRRLRTCRHVAAMTPTLTGSSSMPGSCLGWIDVVGSW
jgi:hypothetical protein